MLVPARKLLQDHLVMLRRTAHFDLVFGRKSAKIVPPLYLCTTVHILCYPQCYLVQICINQVLLCSVLFGMYCSVSLAYIIECSIAVCCIVSYYVI